MNEVKEIKEVIDTKSGFDKIVERANEIQSKCSDHIVRGCDIKMDDELYLNFNDKQMKMSDFATSGIC